MRAVRRCLHTRQATENTGRAKTVDDRDRSSGSSAERGARAYSSIPKVRPFIGSAKCARLMVVTSAQSRHAILAVQPQNLSGLKPLLGTSVEEKSHPLEVSNDVERLCTLEKALAKNDELEKM